MFYSPERCPDDDFETMGWWSVAPSNCVKVYANDLAKLNQYWYYYAQADDGAVWAGPYQVYVPDKAFSRCSSVGESDARIVGMRELDIGDNADYTLTFVA